MEDGVTIKQIPSGWQVWMHKTHGVNKGDTLIATLCGGWAGKEFAKLVAMKVMADQMFDGDIKWELL